MKKILNNQIFFKNFLFILFNDLLRFGVVEFGGFLIFAFLKLQNENLCYFFYSNFWIKSFTGK